jgi:hypothetical protein
MGAMLKMPALLTRMSIPPQAASTAATPAAMEARSVTSIRTAIAFAPSAAAVSRASASRRSATATFAPSAT